MAQPDKFRLKLSKLNWISLVDTPAQQTATLRLLKRAGSDDEMEATAVARLVKIDTGSDPLAYFWAFTCTDENGKAYHDLQGDAVSPEFVKVAERFMSDRAAVDEMHNAEQTSRVAFAFPWDSDIASAMLGPEAGAVSKISGLMVAIRPAPEALAKLRDGTYNGVSIAGTGMRYAVTKSVWSTAVIDDLPDSSFLYIEGGGKKDTDGKTTPRSLRHFPYKDGNGTIDIAHLRDAIGRIPQSSLPASLRESLQVKAEKLLAKQHTEKRDVGKAAPMKGKKKKPGMAAPAAGDTSTPATYKRVGKMAALTSVDEGHQHSIDLDDPADCWRDMLMTSYQTADGATEGHCHAWVYDGQTGKITIALDSGHSHTIDAVVPQDVIADAAEDDEDDDDKSDGVPCGPCGDEDSSGAVVINVNARAPQGALTQSGHLPTVSPQEPRMPTAEETQIAALRKMLAASLALSEPQRLYLVKQAPADVESFLAMTADKQAEIMKAADAANPEVYKTAGGMSIRKSDGALAEQMARQLDEQSKISKAQADELAVQKAAAEWAGFEKRAGADLSHFAKTLGVRASIVKAIDGISDEAVRKDAHEALKGANFALAKLGSPTGADDHQGPGSDDPQVKLDEMAKKHAADNKVTVAKAMDAVLQTPEGAALYNEIDKRAKPALRSV